ncbi:hypothetical protein BKA61DRAFT_723792 [Leptodontidium sp. MPI-SDFR-AT-0119]|nr:hypothetical protein BKA61DRAFT_723792 [Leptodontidium sp. MPI-SDFR-AT-0119]
MKFSTFSAATLLAALFAVQAAPLNARDTSLTTGIAARTPGRTVGEINAENQRLANEKGIPLDRKLKTREAGRTVGEINAERQRLANEKGIPLDRK